MTVTVHPATVGRVRVLHVRGDLDLVSVDGLRRQLADACLDGDPSEVVVDLTGVAFIDSTGLGVLVDARNRLVGRGRALTLVVDRESLLRVFRISSLARLFTIHPTLHDAVPTARPRGVGRAGRGPVRRPGVVSPTTG
jgi:anti-sigma B factor antagonist